MPIDFEGIWSKHSTVLHDKVDELLGDRVLYSVDGEKFAPMAAFIIEEADGETSTDGLDDDFKERKRLKIRKSLVPMVMPQHRVQHPRLGPGSFRLTNSLTQTEGEYWLFDVQKANS